MTLTCERHVSDVLEQVDARGGGGRRRADFAAFVAHVGDEVVKGVGHRVDGVDCANKNFVLVKFHIFWGIFSLISLRLVY